MRLACGTYCLLEKKKQNKEFAMRNAGWCNPLNPRRLIPITKKSKNIKRQSIKIFH
uniref:Uncharacterized protein n=1 Tax=Rhizophora mucronata TaxID=61149 RepID=A0A2P2MIK3_RHIMU